MEVKKYHNPFEFFIAWIKTLVKFQVPEKNAPALWLPEGAALKRLRFGGKEGWPTLFLTSVENTAL
jgi:hypothetical protein